MTGSLKALSFLVMFATVILAKHNINLGPAYSVRLDGTKDWTLVNTFSKQPYFVEGLEMLNDKTLLQSAGLYSGS